MSDWTCDFMPQDGQLIPRTMGELLASFVRRRWPRDTAKHVERSWELDRTTATNLTKGHASERTITKALKAEGWPLLMALGEAMTGQSYEEHLQEAANEHERALERARARQDHVARLEARARRVVDLLDGQDAH